METPRPRPPRPHLWLIAALYVSQAVPLGFFTIALPAILRRRGASLETIGLISALALPFLLKPLWAPFVDRFGSRRGHYRSWILPLQALAVVSVAWLAALDPARDLALLAVVGGIFMLLAATQDVATDGLSVKILSFAERGPGNAVQVGGFFLGQILGGGVLLLVYERFGWSAAALTMAALLALPLVLVVPFREPVAAEIGPAAPVRRLDYAALGRFFRRAGFVWVLVVLLYRAGEAMATRMLNPLLVDRGGLLLGVVGSLAALAGSLVGGLWVGRLGRRRALVLFAGIQTGTLGAYLLLTGPPPASLPPLVPVLAVVAAAAFAGGMATAALYTHMMDRSHPRTGATDFSLQQGLAVLGPLVGTGVSGYLTASLGYAGFFAACAALNLLCALAAYRWLEVHEGISEEGSRPSPASASSV